MDGEKRNLKIKIGALLRMKVIKHITARPISPRRELIRRIRHLSDDKIEIILNTIKLLDNNPTKSMAELEHDIKTGEYKNWTDAEYIAWDKNFTKLTPAEANEIKEAEKQIAKGESVEWKPGMFTESY